MKKRKQTCSTKHIHCAKVSENLFFPPETIFYGINCCNRVLLREEPQEENFFPGIFWQHFLIRKSAKSGVLAKRSGNRLCQHSGHFLGILDTFRGPSIWTYCSSIWTYFSCFWTCWPPPIAVIFCQFLRKSACQKVPFMQPWRRASLVASEILCFQRKVLFDKKLNRPLNHQEQEDFN